jgi:AP-1 complex subunit beta-1
VRSLPFNICFSALFPDVVNCMQTDNLELKKLVYLYLMNYAKSQPDLAIMAVNTFVKVCDYNVAFFYFLFN